MRPAFLACLLLALALPAQASIDPVNQALESVGVKYRFGGRSPETGFDCSGLVTHVYERAWGLSLPAGTAALSKVGRPIRAKELQPGDLVFYNTRNRPYSHVGIYAGEGLFIHAPKPGGKVRVEKTGTTYWRARFNGARRVEPVVY
jgi:cell wall-associated NlpC family hydrolase